MLIAAGMLLGGPLSAAHAQSGVGAPAENEQHRGENGGGDKPVSLSFTYSSDLNADVAGGQSRGVVYLGRASLLLDANLERLIGLHGAKAHASVHQIHGVGLSGRHVGNLSQVSGLEAEPAIRLNQLWIEVTPAASVALRLGKFTAAQEFMSSATASLFVNASFGWPTSFATDLPSGGPSYPLAAPGARIAIRQDKRTAVQVAVFAGDPAGPGSGDPQRRDRHGFNTFGFAGRPFVIGQVTRRGAGDAPALTATVGGWVQFGRSAAPGKPGPATRGPDFSAYGLLDMRLWQSHVDAKRTASAFMRLSYSPSNRNIVDLYADGGLALAAPFRGRDGDSIGLAISMARISPDLRSTVRSLMRSGVPAAVPPPFEAVAEISYQAAVFGPLKLQPNLQYIVHPAGNALPPQTAAGRVPDALVLGLRSAVFF